MTIIILITIYTLIGLLCSGYVANKVYTDTEYGLYADTEDIFTTILVMFIWPVWLFIYALIRLSLISRLIVIRLFYK